MFSGSTHNTKRWIQKDLLTVNKDEPQENKRDGSRTNFSNPDQVQHEVHPLESSAPIAISLSHAGRGLTISG